MLTRSPLKILLADSDYGQYLLLKQILQEKCNHYCNLFWYRQPDQYLTAIVAGTFDLAIMSGKLATEEFLKNMTTGMRHTPIVLVVDSVTRDDAMAASHSGVFGVLDKHHLDDEILGNYLVCAELFHRGELEEGFVAEVPVLGKYSMLQNTYTYIH